MRQCSVCCCRFGFREGKQYPPLPPRVTPTYGSGAGTRKETSGDNNVYSAVVQSGSNTTATISVIMYGSGASGNAYLSNGGTIKSDTVNIQISGYNERRITVTDA